MRVTVARGGYRVCRQVPEVMKVRAWEQSFEFGVVGAGWRTDFFLRVAEAIPGMAVSGVVARRPERAALIEAEWRVPCFASITELLRDSRPSFLISSVTAEAMPEVCLEIAEHRVPILAETPPAPSLDSLVSLHRDLVGVDARIQVAEQYWAQPLHAARQAIVDAGTIGAVNQVHLSVCHGYHAMSLIRRLLDIGYEAATIRGQRFRSRVIAGPDRGGPPDDAVVTDMETDYAFLDFGDRLGVYEFCLPQYRSWIRGQRVDVRGERGEIIDDRVTYLKDATTPITAHLTRHEAGPNGNLEGFYLKGIQYLDEWVYLNDFAPARLTDEEIAVARCLQDMSRYVNDGAGFYSLEEACQDQYLALMCSRAIETGDTVRTERQPWSGQT